MSLLIKGAKLIDGTGNPPREDSLVEIEGQRITWVGPASESRKAGEVIPGEGMTLLPGLINCHVHLARNGEVNPARFIDEAEETIFALRNMAATISQGVTTVRDCGTRTRATLHLSRAIQNEVLLGPRIVSCGRCLTMTGGHAPWLGYEVDGVEELRKAARKELKAGAHWIKLIATGGVLTPGTDIGAASFTGEEMAAAVEEAKKVGRRVAAHAIGTAGIKNALRAGVRSIEHGSYLDTEAIEMMLENQVSHVPTLSAYHQVVTHAEDSGIHPDSVRKAQAACQNNTESLQRSLAAGVNVAAGTDAGTPYNYHGGIGLELELLVEAGASPMQAVEIATRQAAINLGLESEVGTVEAGKIADLILVPGDPLQDIRILGNPAKVIKSGRLVPGIDSLSDTVTFLRESTLNVEK